MLKIFLVEDEIVMREGIKNNVNWEKEGFEFVGDASDGELAYPMIQKEKPDILITDIKMPFMDGLELSRLVKKELPDTRIILLSGYDEFQYAKEAIEIGIAEYLVKPVTSVQLMEAVKKVERKIEEDLQKKESLQHNEKSKQEQKIAERKKLFCRMVSGKIPFSILLQESREIGVELTADRYNILLLQLFQEEESEAATFCKEGLLEELEEKEKKEQNINVFEQGHDEIAIVLKEREKGALEKVAEEIKTTVVKYLQNGNFVTFFGAFGNPVERLSELKKCYEEANREFSNRYVKERNQFVSSEREKKEAETEELDLNTLNVSQLDRRKLEQFLSTGTKSEVSEYIEEYFTTVGNQNIQSLLFRQYVILDFYVITAGFLEEIGYKSQELVERCGDAKKMTAVLGTIEQTKDYLKKLFETAIEMRESVTESKYKSILKRAKSYIEENYDKDEISLNTVAAEVNLSPSHFSTIFAQEMGVTFVEYLTRVRMEKAKQLLRATSKRTTDIAFEVGYRDAHYFSNLFKKTQGCTPREYRSGE